MTLTSKELRTVEVVFDALLSMGDKRLNKFLGSITIEEMRYLWHKLSYREYCEKHDISFEDMTDNDFMQAYFEKMEA